MVAYSCEKPKPRGSPFPAKLKSRTRRNHVLTQITPTYARVALSLFKITTVPSFAAKVAFCPGLRFGRRRPPTRTPLEGRRRSADGGRRWRGWGDLRKDTVPPGAGHGVNEERTSSGARLFTLVGYHSGGALSRDIVSTRLAQDFFKTFHHQDTKTPSDHKAIRCIPCFMSALLKFTSKPSR